MAINTGPPQPCVRTNTQMYIHTHTHTKGPHRQLLSLGPCFSLPMCESQGHMSKLCVNTQSKCKWLIVSSVAHSLPGINAHPQQTFMLLLG